MMRIVTQVNRIGLLYMEVKTSVASAECADAFADDIIRCTAQLCHSHGCNGILDIDERRPVEFKVVKHTVGGTEVEEEVATIVADIDSVVVGIDTSGGIGAYIGE